MRGPKKVSPLVLLDPLVFPVFGSRILASGRSDGLPHLPRCTRSAMAPHRRTSCTSQCCTSCIAVVSFPMNMCCGRCFCGSSRAVRGAVFALCGALAGSGVCGCSRAGAASAVGSSKVAPSTQAGSTHSTWILTSLGEPVCTSPASCHPVLGFIASTATASSASSAVGGALEWRAHEAKRLRAKRWNSFEPRVGAASSHVTYADLRVVATPAAARSEDTAFRLCSTRECLLHALVLLPFSVNIMAGDGTRPNDS